MNELYFMNEYSHESELKPYELLFCHILAKIQMGSNLELN
jgi:hypothetical protein